MDMATITQTLRWGSNGSQVETLQTILNARVPIAKLPNGVKLVVDGVFGSKTYQGVRSFQSRNKYQDKPLKIDGIVGEKTRAILNKASSVLPNNKKTPQVAKKIKSTNLNTTLISKEPLIKNAFTKVREDMLYAIFVEDTTGIRKEIEILLAGITTLDGAVKLVKTYSFLKKLGFSGKEIREVFKALSKLNAGTCKDTLDFFNKATNSPFGRLLEKAGKIATKANYIIVLLKCIHLVVKEKYAEMMAEVYAAVMGKLLPYYGLLDALQTFIDGIIPKKHKYKLNYIFKILKMANPIAAGKVGIEAAGAIATALYQTFYKKNDFAAILRLEELVKNMHKGSLAALVKPGENLGSALYDLSKINTREWKHLAPILANSAWRNFKANPCILLRYSSPLASSICSAKSGLSYYKRATR